MKGNRFISFIILFTISAAAQAQDIRKWSLQECVNLAYENNLNVKRSVLSMENEEAFLLQSRLNRLPNLNFNIFNSWRWGRSIDPTTNLFINQQINSNGSTATSQMILFNGMQQVNTVRQGEKSVEASYYELQKAKNDVALDVVAGYLQVIFNRELLENARFQLNATSAQLDQIEKQVNAGALPITNLLNLKSQRASNEVDVITAENNVNLAVLRLKQFLLIPAEEPFDIVTPDFSQDDYILSASSSGYVFGEAEKTQPEVKAADLRIKQASLGLKVARGAHIPVLAIQGQFFTNYSDQFRSPTGEKRTIIQDLGTIGYLRDDPTQVVNAFPLIQEIDVYAVPDIPNQWANNRSWSAGFNVSVPIFNNWQTRTRIQQSKIQEKIAEINAVETRNILRQTIETAYTDAVAAMKVYDAAIVQVEALEESFRATERSYSLGASNYVDYQVVSFNLFSARSNLVRAKFDYIFRLKVIDFYLGNPLTL